MWCIIPPFTALAKASELIGEVYSLKLGAQNMSAQKSGAFTGEISAAMLRELFVRYVVIGHSERRQLFGETDKTINAKLLAVHEATLKPIFCIGETLAERDGGLVEAVLMRQLREGLAGLDHKHIQETVVAYEPVWAIGTGRNATPRAGSGGTRPHPLRSWHRSLTRKCCRTRADSVWRQRQASECRRTPVATGHRRRAGGWRKPRPARLRRDRQGSEDRRKRKRNSCSPPQWRFQTDR